MSHSLDYNILGGIGKPRLKLTWNESLGDLLGKEQRSPGSLFQDRCFMQWVVRLASRLQRSRCLVLGRCGEANP